MARGALAPVTLLTCVEWPDLSVSDRCLADALERRGMAVQALPWTEADPARLAGSVAVLRACWDYPANLQKFLAWVSAAERHGVCLLNPPSLLRWNCDKRYLRDLACAGVAVPRSFTLPKDTDAAALRAACHGVGASDAEPAVLKPCWGGSGDGVMRAAPGTAAQDLAAARAQCPGRPLLVQQFLPAIAEGELSMVFVQGQCTHAVRKAPAPGEFRVNSRYAPPPPLRCAPPPSALAAAARVFRALPGPVPLYARIDGVMQGGLFICLEVELIEPALYLHLAPDGADALADAVFRAARGLRAFNPVSAIPLHA